MEHAAKKTLLPLLGSRAHPPADRIEAKSEIKIRCGALVYSRSLSFLWFDVVVYCLLSRPLSSVVVVPCGINQKIKKRHKGRDSLLSIDAKDDGRTARIGGANPHTCRSQDFIFFQFLKFIS